MRKNSGKFFCFSPPVMFATFFIEIVLASYTILRYKLNAVGRLVVALLVFLAIFQAAEFNVCAAAWADPMVASRIGYIAITILPPLGLHLAYALAGAKKRPLMWPAYASGAAFITFFLTIGNSLTGHVCQGNYVIFQMAPGSEWLYALYYYGWLFAAVAVCLSLAKDKTTKVKRALYGLAVGYAAFILPTTTANLLSPDTLKAIPSVMCGFAVILAVMLVFWILPQKGESRWTTLRRL